MKARRLRAPAPGAATVTLACATLALAYGLKRFYSLATVESLDFILRPSAWLTSLLLRTPFVFQADEGYLSRDVSILIGKGCAGVNFWIIAFVTFVAAFGLRPNGIRAKALASAAALPAAFALTVIVNALRIAASVWLAPVAALYLGLSFQAAHRYIGIALYLGTLFTLVLGFDRVHARLSSRPPSPARVPVLIGLTLACYLAVTLLVPWLRGPAGINVPFADARASASHAHAVLMLALGLGLMSAVVAGAVDALRRFRRGGAHAPCREQDSARAAIRDYDDKSGKLAAYFFKTASFGNVSSSVAKATRTSADTTRAMPAHGGGGTRTSS